MSGSTPPEVMGEILMWPSRHRAIIRARLVRRKGRKRVGDLASREAAQNDSDRNDLAQRLSGDSAGGKGIVSDRYLTLRTWIADSRLRHCPATA